MEAVRVASAASASTSKAYCGLVSSTWLKTTSVVKCSSSALNEGLSVRCRVSHDQLKTRAIAKELITSNGSIARENGPKVDVPKLAGGKVEGGKQEVVSESSLLNTSERHSGHFEATVPLSKQVIAAMAAAMIEMKRKKDEKSSADITVKGKLVENDFVYRQTFVIRSYEVGFDRTASIETLTNLFQETALNHVGMSDFVGDGMGTTHAMMRHRLIWVVTRMHVQVERYPVWGDVVEIDTWVAGEGKNGMRRDWVVHDANGQVLASATSTWVTMNQDTRRLSKMPDDVRAEISPYFIDRWVMKEEPCGRIKKLNDDAPYIRSDLVPRLNDMDMNQHVNNVKYIGWALESVPQSLSVAHELTSMILEYKRECCPSDIVQSLTSPDEPLHSVASPSGAEESRCLLLGNGALDGSPGAVSCSTGALKLSAPALGDVCHGPLSYTHLLRMQCDGTEIVRGRTVWRLKPRVSFLCNVQEVPIFDSVKNMCLLL